MRDRPTEFESRVYGALRRIPPGRVMTYAELARAIGCASTRAVGQALRRNPDAPHTPCHRVIRSDLRPGGYQGKAHSEAKLAILRKEGVLFRDNRLADPTRILERV